MIYLLDTDTLIFLIRGLKSRRTAAKNQALKVVEQCRKSQEDGHSVAISAVSISELEFGARKSERYEEEIAAVHKVLTPFDLYDFDSGVCPQHYGCLRHELETKGLQIGSMDLLIAAHALSLDATLVSNNIAHFSRVHGLKLISWCA